MDKIKWCAGKKEGFNLYSNLVSGKLTFLV
jgi:hypothetical protein